MHFNNVDIIILLIILISALIALNRGIIKELLSITGWTLGVVSVIYLLPYVNSFTERYIEDETMSVIVTSVAILIIFFIFWIYISANMVGKIRSSKLSNMDRLLGLFFGVLRAFLLIILLNILVNWIIPENDQPDALWDSKLFQLAGKYAEPVEKLIPQETIDAVNYQKAVILTIKDEKSDEEEAIPSDIDNLFEQLTQPGIKKKTRKISAKDIEGYNKMQQQSMDRLIEMVDE
jgi:membrane protein required for colicin V production